MPSDGPSLILAPQRAGVVAGEPVALDVLVRVQAPDAPPAGRAARAPLHLALVIDRSGSMQGRPLEEAKRCAIDVVEHLSPRDRVAVVAYDDRVVITHAAAPVTDVARLRRQIAAIHCGGSTALHAGWVAGAQQLLPSVRPDALSRVLLLSDGQANHGVVDPGIIANQAAELAALGVTTSTYGLGHEFNEDLMTAMARAGEGNARYGETADDLREPFATELALLDALWAKRVTLRITALPGIAVTMCNDYPEVAPRAWRLPSIAFGSEAWALLSVRGAVPHGEEAELLRAAVSYETMDGQPFELEVPSLVVPVVRRDQWGALGIDELVARRRGELEVARLQMDANAAALDGDWARVDELLAEARRLAAENPWLAEVIEELEGLARLRDELRFRKETRYQSEFVRGRLAAKCESPELAAEALRLAYLQRKKRMGKAER